ncbi:IRF3 factor, partial [Chionis minor]|nr:IRF3 factor [Chionis minor]
VRREPQKLRFGPWLLSAVSSGKYRGLRWVDPDRRVFRVPWKHNSRKDITSSDVEVFRVGGMGADQQGTQGLHGGWDGVSPAATSGSSWWWKTNFRCALTSTRMFVLLEDHSKCGDDPHKVF